MTRKDEVSETKRPLCERSTLSMRCCLSPCGRVAGHDGDCEPVHEYSCAPTPEPVTTGKGKIERLQAEYDRLTLEAAARPVWRCYHCAATFRAKDLVAAREHFGLNDETTPKCFLDLRGDNARLTRELAEERAEAEHIERERQIDGEAFKLIGRQLVDALKDADNLRAERARPTPSAPPVACCVASGDVDVRARTDASPRGCNYLDAINGSVGESEEQRREAHEALDAWFDVVRDVAVVAQNGTMPVYRQAMAKADAIHEQFERACNRVRDIYIDAAILARAEGDVDGK